MVAPLVASGGVLGCLYADVEGRYGRFGTVERDLLALLASHAAAALGRLQSEHALSKRTMELERRDVQLAVLDSIHSAMASTRDFQAIVDAVGDKLRAVFDTGDMAITWRDEPAGVVRFLYAYEHGKRQYLAPLPDEPDRPLRKALLKRKPVVVNTQAEADAFDLRHVEGTDPSKSSVFAPMFAGDRILGAIILEDYERESAFAEAEVRLLSTVASGMGVALENARLFAETQRLLNEAEQRNAELALINSIQQGMAGSLDFQGIVELVGEQLRGVFGSDNLSITWRDGQTGLARTLYVVQHGERVPLPPPVRPDPQGRFMRALLANQAVLANSREEMDAWGLRTVEGLQPSLATLTVPIFGADTLLGGITLDSHHPDRRFSEADQRLLQTVAAGLGLGLENVRLFNETKEALQQQTATAEVLQVISGSPTDVQPVFDAIVRRAMQLCDGCSRTCSATTANSCTSSPATTPCRSTRT